MPNQYGQYLSAMAVRDSGFSVSIGTYGFGSGVDLGDLSNSPKPVRVDAEFAITNSSSTDGYNAQIYVQFSDNNTDWPSAGEGSLLLSRYSASAGADLVRSSRVSFTPKGRYYRFQYYNGNGTDALSFISWSAHQLFRDAVI